MSPVLGRKRTSGEGQGLGELHGLEFTRTQSGTAPPGAESLALGRDGGKWAQVHGNLLSYLHAFL